MVAAVLAGANETAAQNQRPVVVTVEYMKVAPGQDDAYLQVEQKMWKPIHEARVKAGKAIAWYLYRVASPSGTLVDHNYVTGSHLQRLRGDGESVSRRPSGQDRSSAEYDGVHAKNRCKPRARAVRDVGGHRRHAHFGCPPATSRRRF
jgi:hypothetical protein